MFNKDDFKGLIDILSENLEEKLYVKQKSIDKFHISDCGVSKNNKDFTQLELRVEQQTLIISWLYLSKPNVGIGTKIIEWLIKLCIDNNISTIEVRTVDKNNIAMKRLLNKFKFVIKNSDKFDDYIRVLEKKGDNELWEIVKGTKEEMIEIKNNYNLKLDWEDIDYYKIILNKDVVGLIEYGPTDDSNTYMIYNVEIFNKSQGIGGKFIDELTKDKDIKLQVYPLNDMSKKFWEKHSFRIIDDNDGLMENI